MKLMYELIGGLGCNWARAGSSLQRRSQEAQWRRSRPGPLPLRRAKVCSD